MSDLIGINSQELNYEVALDALGRKRQPIMRAMYTERAKPTPSQAYIDYCRSVLAAIDDMQDSLLPSDVATIDAILRDNLAL